MSVHEASAGAMRPRTDRGVVGIAYLSFLVLAMPGTLLNVAWSPAMRESFDLPLHAIGTLLLASTSGYVGGSWISGRLTAGTRLGRLLAGSTLVSGLGMLASALAPS